MLPVCRTPHGAAEGAAGLSQLAADASRRKAAGPQRPACRAGNSIEVNSGLLYMSRHKSCGQGFSLTSTVVVHSASCMKLSDKTLSQI